MRYQITLAVALLVSSVSPAFAQRCLGAASLDNAPLQVSSAVAFSSSERDLAAGFVAGRENFFGHATASYATLTGPSLGATAFAGGLGGDMNPRSSVVHVCSIADLVFLNGPNLGAVQTSTFETRAGVQAGITAASTPSFSVVPTFGVGVVFTRLSVGYAGAVSPLSVTNDHYGVARFGVGLIMHEQFAVTPMLTIPFAVVGSEASFSVGLSYNFR